MAVSFLFKSHHIYKWFQDQIHRMYYGLRWYFHLTFRETHHTFRLQLSEKSKKQKQTNTVEPLMMYKSNLINANSQIGFQKLICLPKWLTDRHKGGGRTEARRTAGRKQTRRCRWGKKVSADWGRDGEAAQCGKEARNLIKISEQKLKLSFRKDLISILNTLGKKN